MNILVVDDHDLVRKGFIMILKREFPEANFLEASDGFSAIKVIEDQEVSLVLSDISMPKLSGIEMIKQLDTLNIDVPVIILSMQLEHQYAVRAIKAGAYGYISKGAHPDELIAAVKAVLSGKKHITPEIADLLVQSISKKNKPENLDSLSDREIEVLRLIAQGKKVSEIANEISLSVNTISTYRSRILEKLSLKNTSELIRYALEQNLN